MTAVQNDGTAPASVRRQLAALGPFFAVEFYGAGAPCEEPSGDWRPMSELFDDAGALDDRVAAVRAFLAAGTGQESDAVEPRAAASVVHLGLVARVLAPLFGMTLVLGHAPAVSVADLRWQPTLGGMFPLALPSSSLDSVGAVLDGAVAELRPIVARFGVGDHILRGNVASAAGGAANAVRAARPDLADAAYALVAEMLDHPMLAGSAHVEPEGGLRRHSCCLIYRAAPGRDGGLCGDCVLASAVLAPRRRDRRA